MEGKCSGAPSRLMPSPWRRDARALGVLCWRLMLSNVDEKPTVGQQNVAAEVFFQGKSTIRLPKDSGTRGRVQHQTIKALSCTAEDVGLLGKRKDTNWVPQNTSGTWGQHLGHLDVSESSEGIVG